MPPLYAIFGVEKSDDSSSRTDSGQSESKPRKRTFAEVKKVIKAEFETHGYTWVRKPQFSGPECLKCTRIEPRRLIESEEKRSDEVARTSVVVDLTVVVIHEVVPTLAVRLGSAAVNSPTFKKGLKRYRIRRVLIAVWRVSLKGVLYLVGIGVFMIIQAVTPQDANAAGLSWETPPSVGHRAPSVGCSRVTTHASTPNYSRSSKPELETNRDARVQSCVHLSPGAPSLISTTDVNQPAMA